MATTKNRINISVSKEIEEALKMLAERDKRPVASVAANLLEEALEMEEDIFLSKIADERLKGNPRWISHDDVWGRIKKHT